MHCNKHKLRLLCLGKDHNVEACPVHRRFTLKAWTDRLGLTVWGFDCFRAHFPQFQFPQFQWLSPVPGYPWSVQLQWVWLTEMSPIPPKWAALVASEAESWCRHPFSTWFSIKVQSYWNLLQISRRNRSRRTGFTSKLAHAKPHKGLEPDQDVILVPPWTPSSSPTLLYCFLFGCRWLPV